MSKRGKKWAKNYYKSFKLYFFKNLGNGMIFKITHCTYEKRGKNMPFPGFETLKTVKNRNATFFSGRRKYVKSSDVNW